MPAQGLFNVFKAWLTVRAKQAFGAVMSLVIYYCVGGPAWSKSPSWRGHGWPPRAHQTASGGLGLAF